MLQSTEGCFHPFNQITLCCNGGVMLMTLGYLLWKLSPTIPFCCQGCNMWPSMFSHEYFKWKVIKVERIIKKLRSLFHCYCLILVCHFHLYTVCYQFVKWNFFLFVLNEINIPHYTYCISTVNMMTRQHSCVLPWLLGNIFQLYSWTNHFLLTLLVPVRFIADLANLA